MSMRTQTPGQKNHYPLKKNTKRKFHEKAKKSNFHRGIFMIKIDFFLPCVTKKINLKKKKDKSINPLKKKNKRKFQVTNETLLFLYSNF